MLYTVDWYWQSPYFNLVLFCF